MKRFSIRDRANKVDVYRFGKAWPSDGNRVSEFVDSLPNFLKADDFRVVVSRCVNAIRTDKPIILMSGAHTLKVGLSPLFIDFLSSYSNIHFATNGAGLIHDLEIACFGSTSEDVQENLKDGSFGMVTETAKLFAEVLAISDSKNVGLGEAAGMFIEREAPQFASHSVACGWYAAGSPYTVHAAIGTDIVCQHPEYDGAKVGKASHIDFQVFCHSVSRIKDGGVIINIGSAVTMPEVFLKALSVAKNLDASLSGFTTANFDMINHYRPSMNVVNRPKALGAEGFNFAGHHEIMIPLLLAAIKERTGGV